MAPSDWTEVIVEVRKLLLGGSLKFNQETPNSSNFQKLMLPPLYYQGMDQRND